MKYLLKTSLVSGVALFLCSSVNAQDRLQKFQEPVSVSESSAAMKRIQKPKKKIISPLSASEGAASARGERKTTRRGAAKKGPIRQIEFNMDLVLRPASDIASRPLEGEGLTDGREVDPEIFPATQFTNQEVSVCTSTIIGRDTLITAAHCVDYKDPNDKSRTRNLIVKTDDVVINYTCEMHPHYSNGKLYADIPRNSKDVALCVVSSALVTDPITNQQNFLRTVSELWDSEGDFFSNMLFESLNLNAELQKDDQILLTGFGCQLEEVSDGFVNVRDPANNRLLRIGNTEIEDIHSDEPETLQGSSKYSRFDSKSFVGDYKSDLCKGDSGGSVFHKLSEEAARDETGKREIIGINSGLSFFRDENNVPTLVSVFADLNQSEMKSWIMDWIERENAEVCGVNSVSGCRSTKLAALPEPRVPDEICVCKD